MRKQSKFSKLKVKFDVEVVKAYDERNKGNYFIHESEPNSDGKGIDYHNGGEELARKGANLLLTAADLYSRDFLRLEDELIDKCEVARAENKPSINDLREERGIIGEITYSLDNLDRRLLSHANYAKLYSVVVHFSAITPAEYKQGLGEMFFHQTRLNNMCGEGECDSHQFRRLDQILSLIPDKSFLSGERLYQFGRRLVKEILKSHDYPEKMDKAREAVARYSIEDNNLVQSIEEIEALQTRHWSEIGKLRETERKLDNEYKRSVGNVLSEKSGLY